MEVVCDKYCFECLQEQKYLISIGCTRICMECLEEALEELEGVCEAGCIGKEIATYLKSDDPMDKGFGELLLRQMYMIAGSPLPAWIGIPRQTEAARAALIHPDFDW